MTADRELERMAVDVTIEDTGRYRQKNEPTNTNCHYCGKDIWVRISNGHTVYHGKRYYNTDSRIKTAESVVFNVKSDNGKLVYGICDEPCFESIHVLGEE